MRLNLEISEVVRVLLILLILGLLLSTGVACKQDRIESEVRSELWLHDQLPAELCEPDSPLLSLGVYRVVSCKKSPDVKECEGGAESYDEFISYCSPAIKDYFAAHKDMVKDWLAKAKKGSRNVYLATDQKILQETSDVESDKLSLDDDASERP